MKICLDKSLVSQKKIFPNIPHEDGLLAMPKNIRCTSGKDCFDRISYQIRCTSGKDCFDRISYQISRVHFEK